MSDIPDTVTFNGREYDRDVAETAMRIVRNRSIGGASGPSGTGFGGPSVSSDGSVQRWQGYQYGGNRDIYTVLGYDQLDGVEKLEKYRSRYNRQDVAKRVVDAFPGETFKHPPTVIDDGGDDETDTPFEQAANRLIERELNSYWRRVDRAQRLGEYALLMAGFADGQPLAEPVNAAALGTLDDVPSNDPPIAYWNIFPQRQVEDWVLGKEMDGETADPSHPRYNKPVSYYLDFSDVDADATDDDFEWVHWSRIVCQPAEGALETDLKGYSALRPIWNRLIDREKVVGASAEMFYTGADRKIVANVKDDFALQQYSDTGDREDFKDQLSRLINDLQQTMVSTGMEYEVLGGEEVDPSGVVDAIDSSIAAAVEMPKNKLQGNETGERSTTMDRRNWFDTIADRQHNFAAPSIIRPTIQRLIRFGVFPDPVGEGFDVKWPNLNEPTDEEAAATHTDRAQALQQSQLAAVLSPAQKLTFLEEGPEAVDVEPTDELPLDETSENVWQAWDGVMDSPDASD